VLREVGTEQEQAASTLGASSGRYSAESLAEHSLGDRLWSRPHRCAFAGRYGASRSYPGYLRQTQTHRSTLATLENFDLVGAYSASVVLALMAIAVLLTMNLLRPRRGRPMSIEVRGLSKRFGLHRLDDVSLEVPTAR